MEVSTINNQEKFEYLEEKTKLLKAIAHPIRLCIIKCLIDTDECNVKALQDKLGKPQATISQHLSKLKLYGVVEGERRGLKVHYSIISEDVEKIVRLLLPELLGR